MRIGVLDVESAGLFGDLRLIGWMVDGEYHVDVSAQAWYEFALDAEVAEHVVWYAHNADFDAAYLLESLDEIDWRRTIFTNGRLLRLQNSEGIELRDSMALLPGSLDNVLSSWGTQTQKHHLDYAELGYESLADYFTNVPLDDPEYQAYLHADVKGLYEVLHHLLLLTGLDELKLTTASTSVALYEASDPAHYRLVTKPKWNRDRSDFIRSAYYGGRTEVLKPHCEGGYHYDVNSLYPYVMMTRSYPIGYPDESQSEAEAQQMWETYRTVDRWGHSDYETCIVTARVTVPQSLSAFPPLPLRNEKKLIFPVGTFTGTWVGAELVHALAHGVRLRRVIKIMAWPIVSPVFKHFIGSLREAKMSSTGAKREFYKLMQNSLYGKFGQSPQREQITLATDKLRLRLQKKQQDANFYKTIYGTLCEYMVTRYTPFMQPQIAAHVTAYARIYMFETVWAHISKGVRLYYMDTDSLVFSDRMDAEYVDESEYGLFKLENTVDEGIYLLPKLYAETVNGGSEHVVRAKGIDRGYRESMDMMWYRQRLLNLQELQERNPEIVYRELLYRNVPQRQRLRRIMLENRKLHHPRWEHKSLYFDLLKRYTDWIGNTTEAIRYYPSQKQGELCYG